jgi:cysteine desulfurase family protein (TIGR01976 family)
MQLDLDFVRRQFPALAGEWVYLDNAGGSQILQRVVDRIGEFLLTTNVQTGATYAPSVAAAERVSQSRRAFARLINARRPEEVVMGPNSSVMLRFLAEAMASQFRPGDEIVVTNTDHESNIGPWLRLAGRGVEIKMWRCDPETFELDLTALERLMSPRTRLVAVTHASNLLGTINPIRRIADLVHAHDARLCVDAVAYAPHRAIDVQALDADYYACSLYKLYGPHHAVLYGKHELLLELDNLYHYFFDRTKVPHKLEPGNVNYELAWGAAGIVDYLEELGTRAGALEGRAAIERAFELIEAHESAIGGRLLDYLRTRNDVRIIGDARAAAEERVPTISFIQDGRASDEIVERIDAHRIGIRFGDFHARRLVEDLGLTPQNGVVRVSIVHYNTAAEIDRLIDAFDRAL